jgi:hypothetical protein
MYLFIFEDGLIQKASAVGDDDLQSCDGGWMEIIDMTDPENPKRRFDGAWEEIGSIDN